MLRSLFLLDYIPSEEETFNTALPCYKLSAR